MEDEILGQIINERGSKKWKEIATELNERANNQKHFRQGKQCRERWINHLDPNINR
jgi:Myb-like DNA-binding domain